ncbi:hypothetical protein GS483_19650 [Rhodococcus hoagii]|nr:hypothetical protein [Prescottella equi]
MASGYLAGAVLVVAGALLWLWPTKTAEFTNRLRYMPYRGDDPRATRTAGVAVLILGVVLIGTTLLVTM